MYLLVVIVAQYQVVVKRIAHNPTLNFCTFARPQSCNFHNAISAARKSYPRTVKITHISAKLYCIVIELLF